MATNTVFLAGPSLGRLLNLETFTVLAQSGTEQLLQQANGLQVRLIGDNLTYDAQGHGTGGTITQLQLLQNDGTTVIQTLTDINRSFLDFSNQALALELMAIQPMADGRR